MGTPRDTAPTPFSGLNFFPSLNQNVGIEAPNLPGTTPSGNPFHFHYNRPVNEGRLSDRESRAMEAGFEFLRRVSEGPNSAIQFVQMLTPDKAQWDDIRRDLGKVIRNEPIRIDGEAPGITRQKVERSTQVVVEFGQTMERIARDAARDPGSEYFKRVDVIRKQDPELGEVLGRIGRGERLSMKNYATLGGIVVGEVLGDKLNDALPDAIVDAANRRFRPAIRPDIATPDIVSGGGRRTAPAAAGDTVAPRPNAARGYDVDPDALNRVPVSMRVAQPLPRQAAALAASMDIDGPLSRRFTTEVQQWAARQPPGTSNPIERLRGSGATVYGAGPDDAGLLGQAAIRGSGLPKSQHDEATRVLAAMRDDYMRRPPASPNTPGAQARGLVDVYESVMPGGARHVEFRDQVGALARGGSVNNGTATPAPKPTLQAVWQENLGDLPGDRRAAVQQAIEEKMQRSGMPRTAERVREFFGDLDHSKDTLLAINRRADELQAGSKPAPLPKGRVAQLDFAVADLDDAAVRSATRAVLAERTRGGDVLAYVRAMNAKPDGETAVSFRNAVDQRLLQGEIKVARESSPHRAVAFDHEGRPQPVTRIETLGTVDVRHGGKAWEATVSNGTLPNGQQVAGWGKGDRWYPFRGDDAILGADGKANVAGIQDAIERQLKAGTASTQALAPKPAALPPAAPGAPDVGFKANGGSVGNVAISAPTGSRIGVDIRNATVNGSIQTAAGRDNVQVAGSVPEPGSLRPDRHGNVQRSDRPGLGIVLNAPGASGVSRTDVRVHDSVVHGSIQSVQGNGNVQFSLSDPADGGAPRQTISGGNANAQTENLPPRSTVGDIAQTSRGANGVTQQIGDAVPSAGNGGGEASQVALDRVRASQGITAGSIKQTISGAEASGSQVAIQNVTAGGKITAGSIEQSIAGAPTRHPAGVDEATRQIKRHAEVVWDEEDLFRGQSVPRPEGFHTHPAHDFTRVPDRNILSGHGINESDHVLPKVGARVQPDTFIVPKGVTLWLMAPDGAPIRDRLGNVAEISKGDLSRVPLRKFTEGMEAPDTLILPPWNLDIKGSPTTVSNPQGTRVSHLIAMNRLEGDVVVSACQVRSVEPPKRTPWADVTIDLPERYPKADRLFESAAPTFTPYSPNFNVHHGLTGDGQGRYASIGGPTKADATTFTVPEGVTVHFPAMPGGQPTHRLQWMIENGLDLSGGVPLMKVEAGKQALDPLIFPTGSPLSDAPGVIRATRPEGQRLSELLRESGAKGEIVVAGGLFRSEKIYDQLHDGGKHAFDVSDAHWNRVVKGTPVGRMTLSYDMQTQVFAEQLTGAPGRTPYTESIAAHAKQWVIRESGWTLDAPDLIEKLRGADAALIGGGAGGRWSNGILGEALGHQLEGQYRTSSGRTGAAAPADRPAPTATPSAEQLARAVGDLRGQLVKDGLTAPQIAKHYADVATPGTPQREAFDARLGALGVHSSGPSKAPAPSADGPRSGLPGDGDAQADHVARALVAYNRANGVDVPDESLRKLATALAARAIEDGSDPIRRVVPNVATPSQPAGTLMFGDSGREGVRVSIDIASTLALPQSVLDERLAAAERHAQSLRDEQRQRADTVAVESRRALG